MDVNSGGTDMLQRRKKYSKKYIESKATKNGGYTKSQLAEWGVPWPPPKGWKRNLTKKTKEE